VIWAHSSHRAFIDPMLAAYAAGPALALLVWLREKALSRRKARLP
jgi:hypothetical protein